MNIIFNKVNDMKLENAVVLVTGANRGLGLAFAKEALARGARKVYAAARNPDSITLEGVIPVKLDVTNKDDIAKLVEQCADLTLLINNAGVGDFGSFEDMPVETWEKVMKVNLFGVYYVAKATMPYLKQNKEGDIVNVASTAGLKGGPNMSAYCASKAAVISLSQSLMAELRKFNIRVITLTPSTIATDMSIEGKLTDGNPEKVLQPEDFAEWVRDILKMNRRAMIASASIFSTNP